MKAETLLLLGVIAVGGYVLATRMGQPGTPVIPDDTARSGGTSKGGNQARDRAGKAFGVLGALFSSTSGVLQSWGET